jgi:hypothetical protein
MGIVASILNDSSRDELTAAVGQMSWGIKTGYLSAISES